jgi:hypothetical protein
MGRYLTTVGLAVLVALAGGCGSTFTGQHTSSSGAGSKSKVQKSTKSSGQLDPRARKILTAMNATLMGAKTFSFQVREVSDRPLKGGQMVQYSDRREVLVSRPDKLWTQARGDSEDRQVWYDGKTLTVLEKSRNLYSTAAVPGNIENMNDYLFEKFQVTFPLSDLVLKETVEQWLKNVRTGKYLGRHRVGTQVCHHLVFSQDTIDWQIWIDAGKTPVARKLVIHYKKIAGQPEYSAQLDDWKFSPKIFPGQFEAKIPVGTRRVEMKEMKQPD